MLELCVDGEMFPFVYQLSSVHAKWIRENIYSCVLVIYELIGDGCFIVFTLISKISEYWEAEAYTVVLSPSLVTG